MQVYGVYGDLDRDATTLAGALGDAAVLRQLPVGALVSAEAGITALVDDLPVDLRCHDGRELRGVVGFDDWWTTALTALNPRFPLTAARLLVADKAALYQHLGDRGIPVPSFVLGPLTAELVSAAFDVVGSDPVLKPARGAGSRGVYRWHPDLSVDDNLNLYRLFRELGHIDSTVPTLVTRYLGGAAALEVSADLLIAGGRTVQHVVHEKGTATTVHPFVDRVMLSPPTQPAIVAALPQLDEVAAAIPPALGMTDGVLHVELRLDNGSWHVLDIGVRPASGLVSHSVQALTGVDPRLLHLRACLSDPVPAAVIEQAAGRHPATVIACCYVRPELRPVVDLSQQAELAASLRADPAVFGWHLNASAVDDEVYEPDAGLSIGVGAATVRDAREQLRSLTEPFGFVTPLIHFTNMQTRGSLSEGL